MNVGMQSCNILRQRNAVGRSLGQSWQPTVVSAATDLNQAGVGRIHRDTDIVKTLPAAEPVPGADESALGRRGCICVWPGNAAIHRSSQSARCVAAQPLDSGGH